MTSTQNLRIFVRELLRHWVALLTGGVTIAVVGLYQNLGHTVSHWVYGSIAVIAVVVASYWAWLDQCRRCQVLEENLKQAEKAAQIQVPRVDVHVSPPVGSTDGTPQIAMKVVQPEFGFRRSGIDGTGIILEFRLCHLGGRPATSINVMPVYSGKRNFSIQFDVLPFAASFAEEVLRFEVWKGDEPPSRKTRVFGEWGHRLGEFIWDSPSGYGTAEFPVVVWYRDGNDVLNKRYRLLFDFPQDKFDMVDDYFPVATMDGELPEA